MNRAFYAAATFAVTLIASSSAWAGVVVVRVPEPASLAVVLSGVAALAVLKFRRRK